MLPEWLFIAAVIVQLEYVLYFFGRIWWLRKGLPLPVDMRMPVSIVVCARNEAVNLRALLPALLAQDYFSKDGQPLFELVVVDDGSTDDTSVLLQSAMDLSPLLKVVSVPAADVGNKKRALQLGLHAATYNWLAFTDADCLPATNQWLTYIFAPLAKGKQIVAGYGGYRPASGLLNAFVRWETMHTFLQYATYALAGRPYMAVGRNMACTRQVMDTVIHSQLWQSLPYGDDDLLVQVAATKENMTVAGHPSSFTYTESKTSWQAYAQQKRRHLSTSKKYKFGLQVLLGFYAASHALFWLSFIWLACLGYGTTLWLVFGIRCAIYWLLWAQTSSRLRERRLQFYFPLFDVGWMVYNFVFLPYIGWKNKQHWN